MPRVRAPRDWINSSRVVSPLSGYQRLHISNTSITGMCSVFSPLQSHTKIATFIRDYQLSYTRPYYKFTSTINCSNRYPQPTMCPIYLEWQQRSLLSSTTWTAALLIIAANKKMTNPEFHLSLQGAVHTRIFGAHTKF